MPGSNHAWARALRAAFYACVAGCVLVTARVEAASVCIDAEGTCAVGGSRIVTRVVVDPDGAIITAAQMSLTFDIAAFELISIEPGASCDPASAFQQELFENVNNATGEIFYAVAISPGTAGITQPAAVACLVLQAKPNQSGGDLCILTDVGSSFLTNDTGDLIPIDNSTACPSMGKALQSCTHVAIGTTCTCVGGAADCAPLSDGCHDGVCVENGPAQCVAVAVKNGAVCDDGIACTDNDVCTDGQCLGTGCLNPSVCLATEEGCNVAGGTVVRAVLGSGGIIIAGAQLNFAFDPSKLELLDVAPGVTCDPTSPFTVEVDEQLNAGAGELFYAVGIDFLSGGVGTQGPATLACLTFAPTDNTARELCLTDGVNQGLTLLTDEFGQAVPVFNALDCPSDTPGVLTCKNVSFDANCICLPDSADCTGFTTDCRMGFCDLLTSMCRTQPINNGEACDDGRDCTRLDRCIQGGCFGFQCNDPSLCIVGPGCVGPGHARPVEIRLGAGDPVIVGGQFALRYDPDVLQFVGAGPGTDCDPSSPFTNSIFLSVNEAFGEIFFATGIDFDGAGTSGPAVMACLKFVSLVRNPGDVCVLNGVNPFRTLLVDENGASITAFNQFDCPADSGPPLISCGDICTVPTVGHWGMILLTLMLLAGSKIVGLSRRRAH